MVRREVYSPYKTSRMVMYPRDGFCSGLPCKAVCTFVAGEKKPSIPLREVGAMQGTILISHAAGRRGKVITI